MVYESDKGIFSTKIILDSDLCHDEIDTLIPPLKTECIWIQLFNIYSVIMKTVNNSDGLHDEDLEATAWE
jgi:hypothetical protein